MKVVDEYYRYCKYISNRVWRRQRPRIRILVGREDLFNIGYCACLMCEHKADGYDFTAGRIAMLRYLQTIKRQEIKNFDRGGRKSNIINIPEWWWDMFPDKRMPDEERCSEMIDGGSVFDLLNPVERFIIEGHYADGKTFVELDEIRGLVRGSTAVRHHRILKKMREQVA